MVKQAEGLNALSYLGNDPFAQDAQALAIHCLGPFRIEFAGSQIDPRGKFAELILLLALSDDCMLHRRDVSGFLWGELRAERASHNLRQLLLRLRDMPFGGVFDISPQTIRLQDRKCTCDWWDFLRLSASGAPDEQERATRLNRGAVLGGFVPEGENFAEWVQMRRRQMEEAMLAHALRLGETALSKGQAERARGHAMQALAIDNFREDAHRLVMRALDAMDRRPEALRHYDRLATLLEGELDAEPDELTQTLAASLKDESSITKDGLPALSLSAESDLDSLSRQVDSLTKGHGAVLAFDVAGENPDKSRAILDQVRELVPGELGGILLPQQPGKQGRLFKFASVRAGSAAGLACLKALAARGLRGGLHVLTDAQQTESDLETALRLANLAAADTILLSLLARGQLVHDVDGTLTDLGTVSDPTKDAQIHAFRLETVAQPPELNPLQQQDAAFFPTIAVVPLSVFGDAQEGKIAGQLFAEELINGLGRHSELRVISRLSTLSAQTHNMTSEHIRRLLGASYAVSGTCHIAGPTAHLMLELSDLNDSTSLWSEKMKVPLAELYEINGVIDLVIGRIMSTLMRGKVHLVRQKGLAGLNNCSLMLAAITLMHNLSREHFDFSEKILHHLVERNPGHPVPYSWLALHHLLRASQGWTNSHLREGELALDAVSKALDANPENSLALTIQGHVRTQFYRDFDAARASYNAALASNPNNGLGWLFKSVMHAFQGEGDGAMDGASLACILSPLDPRRWFYDSLGATAALGAGNYAVAIERAQSSIRANALHTSTYRALAIAQVLAGQRVEARGTVTTLMRLQPGFSVAAYRSNHPAGATKVGESWAAALLEAGAPERAIA